MNAIVTGVSSGIGLAVGNRLVDRGMNVVGLSRKHNPEFRGVHHRYDVKCDHDIRLSVGALLDYRVSILVNCAGIYECRPFEHQDPQSVTALINTNLSGTILTCQAFLPYMYDDAKIINIASIAGIRGNAFEVVYSATKAGLRGFAEAFNREMNVSEKGIRMSTIFPGGVDTPLWKEIGYPKDGGQPMPVGSIVQAVDFIIDQLPGVTVSELTIVPEKEMK